jgi:hypothetical protein
MTDDGPDLVAAIDQLQALLVGNAPVWGASFRALIAGGCDETLARDLVRDAHRLANTLTPPEEDTDG